jgi:alpha-glucan,water dikinase
LLYQYKSTDTDVPGFAGAGLYDSIPMVQNEEQTILYHKERLVTDKKFADEVLSLLGLLVQKYKY